MSCLHQQIELFISKGMSCTFWCEKSHIRKGEWRNRRKIPLSSNKMRKEEKWLFAENSAGASGHDWTDLWFKRYTQRIADALFTLAHSQEDSIIAMSLLDPQPHPPPLLGFSGMARSSLLVSSNFLRPALASVLAGGEASFRPPTGPLLPTHSFGQNRVTVFWNPLELSTPLIESQVLKCSQTHRLLPSSCHLWGLIYWCLRVASVAAEASGKQGMPGEKILCFNL